MCKESFSAHKNLLVGDIESGSQSRRVSKSFVICTRYGGEKRSGWVMLCPAPLGCPARLQRRVVERTPGRVREGVQTLLGERDEADPHDVHAAYDVAMEARSAVGTDEEAVDGRSTETTFRMLHAVHATTSCQRRICSDEILTRTSCPWAAPASACGTTGSGRSTTSEPR